MPILAGATDADWAAVLSPKTLNSISPKRRVKATCCLAERCLVKGPSQIDATDLAEHGIGRDNLNRHGRSFC
jgi:hypothetical protein